MRHPTIFRHARRARHKRHKADCAIKTEGRLELMRRLGVAQLRTPEDLELTAQRARAWQERIAAAEQILADAVARGADARRIRDLKETLRRAEAGYVEP